MKCPLFFVGSVGGTIVFKVFEQVGQSNLPTLELDGVSLALWEHTKVDWSSHSSYIGPWMSHTEDLENLNSLPCDISDMTTKPAPTLLSAKPELTIA